VVVLLLALPQVEAVVGALEHQVFQVQLPQAQQTQVVAAVVQRITEMQPQAKVALAVQALLFCLCQLQITQAQQLDRQQLQLVAQTQS
jgi:hypothetical protein